MGAVVDLKVLGKDDLDDLLALYNYNKEPKIEQTNYKEITQTEINEQLDAKKPVYIKVLSRIVDNQYKEHNETGAEWEIRKILRSEGKSTLSKIESAKTGKTNQCFSMVNYGKVNPYNFEGVGLGAFQEDMEKIHLASEVDMSSLHHKGSDLISLNDKYYNSQNRDRENMKIDEKLNSMLDNLEKQEEVSEHNEIIMDVENKDIKFIFWLDNGKEKGESWRKVKALYLQKKYKELSGRTLPIFRYKPGAKDYLKETDFSKEEIIDMLKKEVIDVEKKGLRRGMDNEMFLDLLMTLKDEIDLIPESKEIIGKFIETQISEHSKPKEVIFESNIHNIINLAKYVGTVQGKDAQEKCIKKIFKNLELEIGVFLSTGVNYKGKRDNKKIDIMLELIAEIRGLEAYDNVKDFLEPKLNKVMENVKISKNKKAQKVYSLNKRGFNSRKNYTPLEYAIKKGNQEMVKILIENGADINTINKKGDTPLTYAIQKGSKKMTRVLIEQGADINAMGKDGYTPLTYAIQKGNKEIMKMLLESGVDVNKKDGIGNTPISLAIKKGKFSISYLLIKRKVKCDLSRILSKLKLNKNIKHKSYKLQKEQKLDMQSIKELTDKLKNSKRDIANISISSMDSDDSDITLNAKNRDKKEMTKKDMSKEFGRSKKMSREGLTGRNSYKPKKIHNVNNDKSFKI